MNSDIDFELEFFLEKFRTEYPVSQIFNEDQENTSSEDLKRKLTTKEKHSIVDEYFSRYFIDFFMNKKPKKKHFLFGNLKLFKNNEELHIFGDTSNFCLPNQIININFEKVDSSLISNLITNFKNQNDIDILEDCNSFLNKNK